MTKKKDKRYTITLKGLIENNAIYDKIELYMRRFGYNAIVLDRGTMIFANAEKAKL